jgi:hypothetical protein
MPAACRSSPDGRVATEHERELQELINDSGVHHVSSLKRQYPQLK